MVSQLYNIIELDGHALSCREFEVEGPFINLDLVIDQDRSPIQQLKKLAENADITNLIVKLKNGEELSYKVRPNCLALISEKVSRGFIQLAVIEWPEEH